VYKKTPARERATARIFPRMPRREVLESVRLESRTAEKGVGGTEAGFGRVLEKIKPDTP